MGKTFLGVLGASVLAGSLLVSATAQAEDKVFGWVENAYIEPWGIAVKAKLDSGFCFAQCDALAHLTASIFGQASYN